MEVANTTSVRMFFYGTLKRGERNHPFCEGGTFIDEGRVEGSLYALPHGYPALVVPRGGVLAEGTAAPLRDARRASVLDDPVTPRDGMPTVHGELYGFENPVERLPLLDELEGFVPGNPSSPYRRVLVPVTCASGNTTPAWTYAARNPNGTHLPAGRWPG